MRRGLIIAAVAYLVIGYALGSFMKFYGVPAMNFWGVSWYALTWPAWISSGTFHTPAPPIPDWCFTFKD